MQKSESLDKLAPALVAFQGDITNPPNSAKNPHFGSSYAPLHDILNHVRPVLARHGLSVLQSVANHEARAGVTTLVLHESGEYVETDPVLLRDRKEDAQGAGSAITYARRYSLCAALGISGEDDDDGSRASRPRREGPPPQEPPEKLAGEADTLRAILDAMTGATSEAVLRAEARRAASYSWTEAEQAQLNGLFKARLQEFKESEPDFGQTEF